MFRRIAIWLSFTVSILGAGSAAAQFQPFRPLPPQPPIPTDNVMNPAKIELGQQLFFDARLSVDGSVNCNACHDVMAGGADGRALSVGANGTTGKRNAPTLWNVGYYTIWFWDGRAMTLEAAVEEHLTDPAITGFKDKQALLQRLGAIEGYRAAFRNAFAGDQTLTYENVAKALSAYLRTLVTPDSAFDRYLRGDKTAISDSAKRGFEQYIEIGCASCHFWVNLAGPVPGLAFQTGEGFYELFPNYPGTDYEKQYGLADDIGRYLISGIETDRRMWRVPTMRNVEVSAPYFHNGRVKTLDEAVRVMAKVQLGVTLPEQDVDDIVAFLVSLSGEFPAQSLPRLPGTAGRTVFDK